MATADELFQAALGHERAGRRAEAEALFRQVLERVPQHADALHRLGVLARESGRPEVAVSLIGQALGLAPDRVDYRFDLAESLRRLGQADEARAGLELVLQHDPNHVPALNALGLLEQRRGAWDLAESWFRRAATLGPEYPSVLNNLGTVLLIRGAADEARPFLEQALRLRPDYPEALINLGAVEIKRGRLAEAQTALKGALQLKPDDAVALHNVGVVLHRLGRSREAESALRQVIGVRPDYAPAHFELGVVLKDSLRLSEARECLEHALRLKPDSTEALNALATLLAWQGDIAGARRLTERALAIRPRDGLKIRAALLLPAVYESRDELERERSRLERDLARLETEPLSVPEPVRDVGLTAFFAAYQRKNDRDLLARLAAIHRRATPSLEFLAPHCERSEPTSGRRIRVGFLSSFFYRHTVGKLNLGFVRGLSRERFSVTLLRFPGPDDDLAHALAQAADRVVDLPRSLDEARRLVADERLDVLYYTEIGMDPLTYFLAFARLAPVQCTTWGHSVTSGIPSIDYYLSSTRMEPDDADDHYSERLVRFRHVNCCYDEPSLPAPARARRDFGLDEGATLYVCAQSLFKLHPDFDFVLGAILREDPRGRLVLLSGFDPRWEETLTARFQRAFPDEASRVRFLPQQSQDDFLWLQAIADVLLDPFPFGGCNTCYEAFAFGTPVVTWPGPFLRGRFTLAFYRQMDVMDCVASDPNDYVRIAVRLGTDRSWREAVRSKIRERKHRLYKDAEAVRELEGFLAQAVSGPGSLARASSERARP